MKATLAQGQQVLNVISQSGIRCNDLQRLLESGRLTALLQRFKEEILRPEFQTFDIEVDYSQTLREMADACGFDYIVEEFWGQKEHEAGGAECVSVVLIDFGCPVASDEVLDTLEEQGLKFASPQVLCAFKKAHRDLDEQGSIVTITEFESDLDDMGPLEALILNRGDRADHSDDTGATVEEPGGDRNYHELLSWSDDWKTPQIWSARTRILAVRK